MSEEQQYTRITEQQQKDIQELQKVGEDAAKRYLEDAQKSNTETMNKISTTPSPSNNIDSSVPKRLCIFEKTNFIYSR